MPCRYRIYLLSAQSILSYAKEEGGAVTIALNRDAVPPGGRHHGLGGRSPTVRRL